jgi:branched-chain amino acid transport system permease protein
MADAALIKSLLLAMPLAFIATRSLPTRWAPAARVAVGVVAGWLSAFVVTLLVPIGLMSYLVSFAIVGSIYAVLALGLNVQWGYTGLFNIGIAAFFAIGAFTTALVTTTAATGPAAAFSQQAFGLGAPFLAGVLAAGVAAGVLALLIGTPTLRLRDDYLAIATIGIAELVRLVLQNERWLANGPQPLRGIPQPLACLVRADGCAWLPAPLMALFEPLAPRDYTYVYLVIVTLFVIGTYLVLERAIRSPWGRVLRAVREEEAAAAMNGKDVARIRLQAFVVGAVIMGIGGALYAHYMVAIDYTHFDPLYATFLIWVMLMLGGSGNNRGAIVGAFVIWGVWTGTAFLIDVARPLLTFISPDLAARGPYLRLMLIALLLIFILLYRPKGLIPEERFVSRHSTDSDDAAETRPPPA